MDLQLTDEQVAFFRDVSSSAAMLESDAYTQRLSKVTHDNGKVTWEPPYQKYIASLRVEVRDATSMRDPLAVTMIQSLSISFSDYAQITVPALTGGLLTDIRVDDQVVVGRKVYQVRDRGVDPSVPLDLTLHCALKRGVSP